MSGNVAWVAMWDILDYFQDRLTIIVDRVGLAQVVVRRTGGKGSITPCAVVSLALSCYSHRFDHI